MSVISDRLNFDAVWALTKECFPTMSDAGTAGLTAITLQIIGPLAEELGKRLPPIPRQKILIQISKIYYQPIEKYLARPIANREYDFWNRNFRRLSRTQIPQPRNLREKLHNLKIHVCQRALATTPVSKSLIFPILEELAFRAPLLLASGGPNVFLTYDYNFF